MCRTGDPPHPTVSVHRSGIGGPTIPPAACGAQHGNDTWSDTRYRPLERRARRDGGVTAGTRFSPLRRRVASPLRSAGGVPSSLAGPDHGPRRALLGRTPRRERSSGASVRCRGVRRRATGRRLPVHRQLLRTVWLPLRTSTCHAASPRRGDGTDGRAHRLPPTSPPHPTPSGARPRDGRRDGGSDPVTCGFLPDRHRRNPGPSGGRRAQDVVQNGREVVPIPPRRTPGPDLCGP